MNLARSAPVADMPLFGPGFPDFNFEMAERGAYVGQYKCPQELSDRLQEVLVKQTRGTFERLSPEVQALLVKYVLSLFPDMVDHYSQVARGLANVDQIHPRNLAMTPPMRVPFYDPQAPIGDPSRQSSSSENQTRFGFVNNWTSGSSGSSPFRQDIVHGLPIMAETVSPRELHPAPMQNNFARGANSSEVGVFSLSESENSFPGHYMAQPPPLPSNGRRKKVGHRREASNIASQGHGFHWGAFDARSGVFQEPEYQRHPLPAAPGQIPQNASGIGTNNMIPRGDGQIRQASGRPRQPLQSPQVVLPSNGSAPRSDPGQSAKYSAKHFPHKTVPSQSALLSSQIRRGSKSASANKSLAHIRPLKIDATPSPRIASFPPGQGLPGFVPIGRPGKASRAQGNRWPIERALMERIVVAERDVDNVRGKDKALTYKQIKAKYSAWQNAESTLRGIARAYSRLPEHRERKPIWKPEHLRALRHAVPPFTDHKGKVSWIEVVRSIEAATGKPFGVATAAKKWDDLVKNDLALSDGDEGDGEGGEDSSEQFEDFEVSDEELRFQDPFRRDGGGGDDDDDFSSGAGQFAPGNMPVAWPQVY